MNCRKHLALLGVAVAASVALTACGSSSTSKSASAGGNQIVLYTTAGDTLRANYITQHAKSELGLDVKVVGAGGTDLVTRLEAEKNNPQADVVTGINEAGMNQLDGDGLFTPYTPDWLSKIPKDHLSGSKNFELLTQTPVVMAYNTAKMTAADAPKTWADLAKPEFKGKYSFPDLSGQTGVAAIVGILWPYVDPKTGEVSDEGWDVAETILKNRYPLPAGQALDPTLVSSGKVPIVINWYGGITTTASDNKLKLQIIDAPGGEPFVQTGIAEVKGTKNSANVEKFINWFGSTAFQVGFVNATKNDTPLNTQAVQKLGATATAPASVTKEDIDWVVVSKQLTSWLQKLQLG